MSLANKNTLWHGVAVAQVMVVYRTERLYQGLPVRRCWQQDLFSVIMFVLPLQGSGYLFLHCFSTVDEVALGARLCGLNAAA